MSLADLIRKRGTRKNANANSANVASDEKLSSPVIARIATLALASSTDKGAPDLGRFEDCDIATASSWWRFHYADHPPQEFCYCPPATHAQALAGEPAAITAQPFQPRPRKPKEPLNGRDESLIRLWLARINETDDEIATVLHQCQCDADARTSFIELAQLTDNREAES